MRESRPTGMPTSRALPVAVASGVLFLAGPVVPFLIDLAECALGSGRSARPLVPLPDDPFIEVIVPAYLEAGTIGATVDRLAADLDKAGVRHVVHVVASDDETASAARAAGRVTRVPRAGKPAAVNLAVERSTADVVVLTDANCRIDPPSWPLRALRELQATSLLSANKTEASSVDSLFWRMESLLKRHASDRIGTLAVVGEFLAFRREDYRPVPERTTSDDLWTAIDFDSRGLSVVVSPSIVTVEDSAPPADQWERRVRIAAGQLSEALPRAGALAHRPAGRNYLAHKLYRLTVGAAAFWMALISLITIRPLVLGPFLGLPVAAAVARYRGLLPLRSPADPFAAAVALQAVPLAAALRLARRRRQETPGWRKVPR